MRTLALRDIAGASHSAKRVFAASRVAGLTSLSPAASIQQIQMLSRPVRGTFAALQSTITNVSNINDPEVRPGPSRRARGSDHETRQAPPDGRADRAPCQIRSRERDGWQRRPARRFV